MCRGAPPFPDRRRAVVRIAAAALLAGGCAAIVPKPLPPAVALKAVRVTRLLPQDTRLTVTLVVTNPNAYDLALAALDATVTIDGEPLLTGSVAKPVTLGAGADAIVEMEVRTGLGAIVGALDRLSRQPRVRYELTGNAVVQEGLRLPFRRQGELPGIELPGKTP